MKDEEVEGDASAQSGKTLKFGVANKNVKALRFEASGRAEKSTVLQQLGSRPSLSDEIKVMASMGKLSQLPAECYQQAEEHLKDHLVANGEKNMWKSSLHDFGEWGTGHLDKQLVGITQEGIVQTMVVNIGARNMTIVNPDNYVAVRDGTRESTIGIFGAQVDLRAISFIVGFFDAIAALIVLVFCWYFEFIRIPKVVSQHREELVTPDIYSLYVHHLPRSIEGDESHNCYEDSLTYHFELILSALITEKTMRTGATVVSVRDEGLPAEDRQFKSFCCCLLRRAQGRDNKGRRTGHIVKVIGLTCVVLWHQTLDDLTHTTQHELVDKDLLNAPLLWRIERYGIDRVPLPESRRHRKDAPTECKRTGTKPTETLHDSADKEVYAYDSAVHTVYLQRDFGDQLANMQRAAKLGYRSIETQIREENVGGRRSMTVKAASTIKSKLKHWGTDAADVDMEDRDVIGAFVVFEHTKHRDFIYNEFRFGRTLLGPLLGGAEQEFMEHNIRVIEAPTPSDVFWNNLDVPSDQKLRRRWFVALCTSGMLCIVFVIIGLTKFYAEEANRSAFSKSSCTGNLDVDPVECECISAGTKKVAQDEPAGISGRCSDWLYKVALARGMGGVSIMTTMCAMFGGGFVMDSLARLERPKSVTSLNKKIMTVTFIVYVTALGLVRLISNAKFPVSILVFGSGDYKDLTPEWFLHVGSSIFLTLTLNAFYPLVGAFQGPMYRLWIRLRRKRMNLMTDLLDLYTPPQFPFAMRHAEQLSTQFAMLLFMGGMPGLALLLPFNYLLFYVSDKYCFLRASKTPPRYTQHLMQRHVKWLQFIVCLHSGVSVWLYSHEDTLPSYCSQCHPDDQILGIYTSSKRSPKTPVVPRFFELSAMPNGILFQLICVTFIIRLLVFFVGRNPFADWLWAYGLAHLKVDEEAGGVSTDDAFHNEVRVMQRKGIACTYNIQDMPGYEFLNPTQEIQPAFKLLGMAMGLHGLADMVEANTPQPASKVTEAVRKLKNDEVQIQADSWEEDWEDEESKIGSEAPTVPLLPANGLQKGDAHDSTYLEARSPRMSAARDSAASGNAYLEAPSPRMPSAKVSIASGSTYLGAPSPTTSTLTQGAARSPRTSSSPRTQRKTRISARAKVRPKGKGKGKGKQLAPKGEGKGKGKSQLPSKPISADGKLERHGHHRDSIDDDVHQDALVRAKQNNLLGVYSTNENDVKLISGSLIESSVAPSQYGKGEASSLKERLRLKGKGKGKRNRSKAPDAEHQQLMSEPLYTV